jgi:putative ABC transport system permease protein
MVRTRQRPSALAGAVRAAMLTVERDIPTSRVGSVMEGTWESLAQRFDLVLVVAFGAAALSLAAVGLYGVVSFIVVQRRHEIGVRRAIGATEARLKRSFVGSGLRLAGIGILLGAPLAVAGARALRASLFGVGFLDVWTFAASGSLLLGVAALATYVPARRLSEISPLEALRAE